MRSRIVIFQQKQKGKESPPFRILPRLRLGKNTELLDQKENMWKMEKALAGELLRQEKGLEARTTKERVRDFQLEKPEKFFRTMKEPGTEIYRFNLKDLHEEEIARIYAIQEVFSLTTPKNNPSLEFPTGYKT